MALGPGGGRSAESHTDRSTGPHRPNQEELPLSTRVHELAKELGLKSQELLDRIQRWGLDVKVNALASLDPSMVDRIKQLMQGPSAPGAQAAKTPAPPPLPAAPSSATAPPPPASAPTAPVSA